PADASHPYGHGKVENLSALAETLLLLVTCVWIVNEAVSRLFFQHVEIHASVWAFAVMAMSIIVDVNRSRVLARVAEKHDSQALEADALHFSTDVWSSAVVIAGLAVVKLSEWVGGPPWLARADAVAALVVAMIVIYVSLRLGRRAVDVLLDAAPKGLAEKVQRQVQQIDGVRACHKVRVRRSGAEIFVDLVLEIDGDISFDRAHETTAKVEEVVGELVPRADVVVHYEPGEESSSIAALVSRTARQIGAQAHSIWVHQIGDRYNVELDLEVDRSASLIEAHDLATRLEGLVREASPEVTEVVTHLEPIGDSKNPSTRLEHRDYAELEAQIVSLVDSVVGDGACHHVAIWEEADGLAASLHCSLDVDVPVEEAHDFSARWESHLRERIPSLHRVVIHLEPF
ncbi:MAG TPA: cation diffusion facilitator family transporter, partial [Anaerolineae bacterium]|nr:cation diffusion facilitator family transporter [Anaerolineae bacterium]